MKSLIPWMVVALLLVGAWQIWGEDAAATIGTLLGLGAAGAVARRRVDKNHREEQQRLDEEAVARRAKAERKKTDIMATLDEEMAKTDAALAEAERALEDDTEDAINAMIRDELNR